MGSKEYTDEQLHNSRLSLCTLVSREEARHINEYEFFTGLPCNRGHIAPRLVSTAKCLKCIKEDKSRAITGDVETRLSEMAQGLEPEYLVIAEKMVDHETVYEAIYHANLDLSSNAVGQLIDSLTGNHLFKEYVDLLRQHRYDPVREANQMASSVLKNIANASVNDVISWRTETTMFIGDQPVKELKFELVDCDDIPKETMDSIKEITMTKYGPKVVMYDKLAAVQALHKITHFNEDMAKILDKENKDITPEDVNKIREIWNGKSI